MLRVRFQEVAESFFGKADSNVILVFEDRPFYQRWVVDHQSQCFALAQVALVDFGDFSPRQALFVEQRFPADSARPTFQHLYIQTIITNVVEGMLDFPVVEIFACLSTGVAAFNSVNR